MVRVFGFTEDNALFDRYAVISKFILLIQGIISVIFSFQFVKFIWFTFIEPILEYIFDIVLNTGSYPDLDEIRDNERQIDYLLACLSRWIYTKKQPDLPKEKWKLRKIYDETYSEINDESITQQDFRVAIFDNYYLDTNENGDNSAIVVFRGTIGYSILEIISDLSYDMTIPDIYEGKFVYYKAPRINAGFYNDLLYPNKKLGVPPIDKIFDILKCYNKVYVTGHSLGAALSQVTTIYLAECTDKKIYTSCFGPPRVANKYCKEIVEKHILNKRVELRLNMYGNDIVARVPFESKLYNYSYEHLTRIYDLANNRYVNDSYFPGLLSFLFLIPFFSHLPQLYQFAYRRLQK